jgi:putative NADPH-quinone reductase
VVVVDGHPDARPGRLVHALAEAYTEGAKSAGHEVEIISVGTLEFPLLRTPEDFWHGQPPGTIAACQQAIARADHLVLFFPLWLTAVPALTQGFIEQVMRPGFAFEHASRPLGLSRPLLSGRSARLVVTMGGPTLLFRLYLRSHSVKTLRYMLRFTGFRPVCTTLLGRVAAVSARTRAGWLEQMRCLGREAR